MADEIREALDKEIDHELMEVYLQEASEDGYNAKTERLAKLYKLRIDEKLADNEIDVKNQQLAEAKKEKWLKLGLEAGLGLLQLGFCWVWMKRGLQFEQTGSYTSKTFSGLYNRFGPKK